MNLYFIFCQIRGLYNVILFLGTTLLGTCQVLLIPWFIFRVLLFVPALWSKIFNVLIIQGWYNFLAWVLGPFNGTTLILSGEKIDSESSLVICNHKSECDWMYFWPLCGINNIVPNIRVILKKELAMVPGLGWGSDFADFLFLSRNWTKDKEYLKYMLNVYKEQNIPVSLFMFPEGTDYSEAKHEKSIEYARKNGNLPEYENLLLPRVKGFNHLIKHGRNQFKNVYDITIAFDPKDSKPNFWSALSGSSPNTVFMHINKFDIKDLPQNEEDLTKWMFEKFKQKDELLNDFKKNGEFSKKSKICTPKDYPIRFHIWTFLWHFVVFGLYWVFFSSKTSQYFHYLCWCFFVLLSCSETLRIFCRKSPKIIKKEK